MPYIGHSPTQAGSYIEVDDFGSSFNGSTVAFTLQVGGVNITPNQQNLLVMIDGVLQQPSNAFSVSGSTITFTEAPVSGADLYCLLMGQSASVGQGTIGADELKVSGDGSDGQVLKSDGDGTFTWLSQDDIAAGTLANARTINGVSFNGSANITVTADANTLSNTTLKSTVVNSSLTSVGTLTTLTVDDITINGSTISDSGDLTLDIGADIILDAGGNEIKLKTGGTEWGQIYNSSSDLAIYSSVQDKDIKFQGNDGGSVVTALTLDMSEGGNATFAGNITQSKSGNLRLTQTATGSGEASLHLHANNSTGDSFIRWQTDSNTFCMGFDNSDGDKFILSAGSDPHSDSVINIQPDGSSIAIDKITSVGQGFVFTGTGLGSGHTGIGASGSGGDLRIYTNGTQSTTFKSDGNVLIGTTDNDARLMVKKVDGTSYGQFVTIEGDTTDNNNYSGISFKAGTLANAYPEIGVSNGGLMFQMSGGYHSSNYNNRTSIQLNGSDGHIRLMTGGDPATERMRITSGGAVGVGVTSPNGNMEIDGSNGAELDLANVKTSAGGTDPLGVLRFRSYDSSGSNIRNGVIAQIMAQWRKPNSVANFHEEGTGNIDGTLNEGSIISFYTGHDSSSNTAITMSEQMRITEKGHVRHKYSGGFGNDRWIINWGTNLGYSASNYFHYKTNLWMGGSPSGNTMYIMGGLRVHGYQYKSGGAIADSFFYFHNWNGSFYNEELRHHGSLNGISGNYVSSDGYWVFIVPGNSYSALQADLLQGHTYTQRDIKIIDSSQRSDTSTFF